MNLRNVGGNPIFEEKILNFPGAREAVYPPAGSVGGADRYTPCIDESLKNGL